MQLAKEMSITQPILSAQGIELSAMTHTYVHGYLRTYSLQSIVWRRGGRRIEPIPLGRRQFGSIARGDLLDAFLNMWLCCEELSIGNDIFDVAGAVPSVQAYRTGNLSTHSLCICPHMSPSVTPDSLRTVVHHGERSVMT